MRLAIKLQMDGKNTHYLLHYTRVPFPRNSHAALSGTVLDHALHFFHDFVLMGVWSSKKNHLQLNVRKIKRAGGEFPTEREAADTCHHVGWRGGDGADLQVLHLCMFINNNSGQSWQKMDTVLL